jgi:signal transduction histidine kinase
MYIKVAILISIALLVLSAILAISMTKVAKYNISWIMLTLALLIMAIRRVFEYFPYIYKDISHEVELINSWLGVLTALLITFALIFIKRIFNLINNTEKSRLRMEGRILTAIIRTEENERKRFAKDLHDGLGPLLSNLKMSVSTLENIKDRSEMDEILANMKTVSYEAINGLKQISNNLSPHILENFGLIHALENFAKSIQVNCLIPIEIRSNIEEQRFSYNIEIILYRIFSELINNTIKHSEANLVKIAIIKNNENLEIIYNDNGIGFDLENNAFEHLGMGISNIKSRIKTLNGDLKIITKHGAGFQAIINCPVK